MESSHRGLRRVASFQPFRTGANRRQQDQLSRVRWWQQSHLGLLFLGSRDTPFENKTLGEEQIFHSSKLGKNCLIELTENDEGREKVYKKFEKNIIQPVYETVHGEARQLACQLKHVVMACIRVANKRLQIEK